jgi:two-component system, NarL family, response regulator NreC
MDLGIVDPQVLIRKALCALLADVRDVRVVLDVDHVFENVRLIRQLRPDALLIHSANPASELATIPQIKKLLPQVRLILLTDDVDDDLELRAIRAGVLGCVSKKSEPQVLEEALKAVGNGETWISRRAATRIIGEFARGEVAGQRNGTELTQREQEILALTAKGFRNKEIAGRLLISENTIKTHLLTIYRKLGVSGRMGAAMCYFQGTPPREGTNQS